MNQQKKDFLRKIGNVDQLFGVKYVQYLSGKENLVKAYEVNTGSGLEFVVAENKNLDIFSLKYKGMNCGFMSKAGLSSPYIADQRGSAFRYTQGCGMLYTAGLANTGGAWDDPKGEQYVHGTIKNFPANHVAVNTTWEGDKYSMSIAGDISEAAFWGRNLVLHRTINAIGNENRISIKDEIENMNYESDDIMMLYHFNVGYPLLDTGARFLAPVLETEPLSEYAGEKKASFDVMGDPVDNDDETVYVHKVREDEDGWSSAAVWNPNINTGIYIKFRGGVFNYLVEWKTCKSGDYALGMLPASNKPIGKQNAEKVEKMYKLEPFDSVKNELEIGIIENESDLADYCKKWGIK